MNGKKLICPYIYNEYGTYLNIALDDITFDSR